MLEYKTFDPSGLSLSRFQDKVMQMKDEESENPQNNQLNVDKFFAEFESYCSTLLNSDGDITNFHHVFNSIHALGNIYQFDNVIPEMIQSKMFYSILDGIYTYPYCIFSILIDMVSCSFKNLLLLFQNNLLNALSYGIQSEDHEICLKSFKCLSTMLMQNHSNFEESIIISLLVSANIINLIDKATEKEFDDGEIELFTFFLDLFFEHIPPDSIRTSENHGKIISSFDEFLNGCEEKDCFKKERFEDFIFNGISLSLDSIYYKIIHKSLCFATNSTNVNIICNFCWVIFYLLKRDISTYETIFFDLKFLAHASEWITFDEPQKILEALSLIIAQLFFESSGVVNLPQEEIEQLSSISLDIFDYSSNIDDEDFEVKAICALGNSIIFNEQSFPIDMLDENRRERIISKAINSSFRLSRYYCYLTLAIASIIDDVFLILNSDVIQRIFDFLSKREGNFVESSLYSFGIIFSKENEKDDENFKNLFLNLGGGDLLCDLMNSENPTVSREAELIYDKYIIIKPEKKFD